MNLLWVSHITSISGCLKFQRQNLLPFLVPILFIFHYQIKWSLVVMLEFKNMKIKLMIHLSHLRFIFMVNTIYIKTWNFLMCTRNLRWILISWFLCMTLICINKILNLIWLKVLLLRGIPSILHHLQFMAMCTLIHLINFLHQLVL